MANLKANLPHFPAFPKDCCQHVFCLKCILSWRKEKNLDPHDQILDTKKECPLCRIPSTYLIPSRELITDQKEKQELFDRILKKKSKKDCLFFKRSLRSSKKRDKLLEMIGEKEKESGSGNEGGKVEDSKPWCPFFDDCRGLNFIRMCQDWFDESMKVKRFLTSFSNLILSLSPLFCNSDLDFSLFSFSFLDFHDAFLLIPYIDHRHQITPDSPPYLFNQRAGKYSQRPG